MKKKIAGMPSGIVYAVGVGAIALVGFSIYRQRSVRQAARARAFRRAMLARRRI